MKSSTFTKIVLPILPLILAGGIAEIAVRRGWVRAFLVPAPSIVAKTLVQEADLWKAAGETALASIAGFACSAAAGLVIAIALASSRWVQRMFYP